MFIWTNESIGWYQDALQVTQHHKKLFREISGLFSEEEEVCDIGCGMGYLDIEIAGIVRSVKGIDIDARVIRIFRQELKNRNVRNVEATVSDWRDLQEECCDTLLLCSFGTLERDLDSFMRLCRRRLVMMKRNGLDNRRCFEKEHARKKGANQDDLFLQRAGIPFQMATFCSDFGQPLKNKQQAEHFIRHYKLIDPNADLEQFYKGYLRETENREYPYYLPNPKKVQVLIIEKQDYENYRISQAQHMQHALMKGVQ